MSNLDLSHIHDSESIVLTGSILLTLLNFSKVNDSQRIFASLRPASKQTQGILNDLKIVDKRITELKRSKRTW